MKLSTIFLVILVVILVYTILQFAGGSKTNLTNVMNDAQTAVTISADDLPAGNTSNNYSYSIWFYINDWNQNYGQPKIIYARKDSDGNQSPSVVLGDFENNLNITVSVYPDKNTPAGSGGVSPTHTCNIDNVPLQKWVNLIVSLNGRSLDVYLDGKLVRTCVLPGVAKVDGKADIYLTPNGGFEGFTSKFQYIADSVNPQQAYNIYKEGYGGGGLGGMMDKYKVKVSYLVDNKEKTSFEL